MLTPTATINRTTDDDWSSPLSSSFWRGAQSLIINKLWSGEPAADSCHAVARLLWSDSALYVRFDSRQQEPLFLNQDSQTKTKTMQLWEHDVCELFLASDPNQPRRYAEFEISPAGEWLDLMVDWRNEEPRDWEYKSGMQPFAQIDDDLVTLAFKVPWTAFDRPPNAGDVWVGNLFRQVGSGKTRGYLAWSPTMTAEPQFHVPDRFGEFVFVK